MNSADKIGELLYGLERRLLMPGTRRSPEQLAALLCDDFVEFGSSGKAYDKAGIIAALSAQPRQT